MNTTHIRTKQMLAFLLAVTMVFSLGGFTSLTTTTANAQATVSSDANTTTATNASGNANTTTATNASGNANTTTATNASGNANTTTTTTASGNPDTTASAQTAPSAPVAVSKLEVSDQTMTSITLTWDSVSGMDGYILQTYNYTTKKWDALDTVISDTSKKTYTYIANDLNAGTTHRFRIASYIGTTATVSAYTKSIKTGCKPAIVNFSVKQGNKCARISWDAIKATGYNIYQKTGTGEYEKILTIVGSSVTTQTQLITNLTNGITYTYKMEAYSIYSATDDNVSYSNTLTGDSSNEITITPNSVANTSSSAYLFDSTTTFKASPAYKTYAIAKKINTTKSFITPGVSNTNVNGIESENFVAQGNVCAGAYYLIGAYDSTGVENSVIYVMKRSTHKYLMTLVLPNKEKITDMAYDGTNVWLTAGANVACIRLKTIKSKISTGMDSTTINYMNSYATVSNPEYMAYYDGNLWIGSFSTSKNYMYAYAIGDKTSNKPTLTKGKKMQMPAKTRAITIDDNGYLYVVRSYQVKKGLSGYVSQIRTYLPTWSTTSTTVKKNTYKKLTKLPAMSAGISHYNTFAYIQFDSAKETECNYPTDRSWAIKLTNLR